MSLLLKNHLEPIRVFIPDKGPPPPCWHLLRCNKVLCPAHGRKQNDCWLMPRTHCTNMVQEDFFHKLAECLSCTYFRKHGEIHPQGWNHFIADQVHRYNSKALEHLFQKEESFIEILNRIPDGLFTTDHEFRITYFNPAAEKITGFSAFDAVGMYCKDVFKNSICECDCALKKAVAERRVIHNREYEIRDIDGNLVPIISSTSAFRDNTGRVTGGLEIFKDITELKRLQEEISRRERKYRRIFEGSHDMIYTSKITGEILDVNQAGIDMLGYADKQSLLELGSIVHVYNNPSDREKFLAAINRTGQVKDYEIDFKRRDHTPIHALISSRRYENPETSDIEFEGIIKDITRRKQTEQNLKQRNRELSILNSISAALNHNVDLDKILQTTLKNVLKVLRLKRGAIFLFDHATGTVIDKARYGLPTPQKNNPNPLIFRDRLLHDFLFKGKTVLKPEPIFPDFKVRYGTATRKMTPWLTCFLITIKGKGGGLIGLHIPATRILNPHEIHLMGSLGNFLGGAIENTQLMKTIHGNRQDLRALTEKLFQGQEDERRRIARELHDEAGQSLTAVKLALERLMERVPEQQDDIRTEIDEIRRMVRSTSGEIRRLSYHLHPTLLIDLGLEPALNLYFKQIRSHSGLDIDFSMVGFDQRLHVDIETVLYRYSQEAMTNTLKHSGAENARISIIKSYPKIIFVAEDDGVGFDTGIIGKDKRSLGLLGMRERTALLGGSFQLRSDPGEGTRIRIEIPFSETDHHARTHSYLTS